MIDLAPWQWMLAAVAAMVIGLSKTGIAGLGILSVAVFANLMPAREASGFALPLLICADVVAVMVYRRHAQWSHLWRLFPWTAVGVVIGYFSLARLNNRSASILIGTIILAMLILHLWRQRRDPATLEVIADDAQRRWFAPMAGILAGFATLIANAAGPVMILYLLAMRLPKLEFLGTSAVFFMLVNLFKVPFMADLNLINAGSLQGNLLLAPVVLLGALAGRRIAGRIDQKLFERIALVLSFAAAINLLIR
jgi:uncharacterized protein